MKSLRNRLRLCYSPILSLVMLILVGMGQASANTVNALYQNSQPKYFDEMDRETYGASGNGICGDFYALMAEKLLDRSSDEVVNIKIDQTYLPIKRIMNVVEEDHAIFCGAGRNADREKRFVYSTSPVYDVSNVVAWRKTDLFEASSFAELSTREQPIGVVLGASSGKFVAKQPKVFVTDSFRNPLLALQAVADGRIRNFYYHDLGIEWLIVSNKLPLRVGSKKFRTVPQWLIMSKNLPEPVRKVLDDVVTEIYAEQHMKVLRARYQP